MSLEERLSALSDQIAAMTTATETLIDLTKTEIEVRRQGLAAVGHMAETAKTETAAPKRAAAKKAEPKAEAPAPQPEEPVANITATPEDRQDPANPEPADEADPIADADLTAVAKNYIGGATSTEDKAKRKAAVLALRDELVGKAADKLAEIPAAKRAEFVARVRAMFAEAAEDDGL